MVKQTYYIKAVFFLPQCFEIWEMWFLVTNCPGKLYIMWFRTWIQPHFLTIHWKVSTEGKGVTVFLTLLWNALLQDRGRNILLVFFASRFTTNTCHRSLALSDTWLRQHTLYETLHCNPLLPLPMYLYILHLMCARNSSLQLSIS